MNARTVNRRAIFASILIVTAALLAWWLSRRSEIIKQAKQEANADHVPLGPEPRVVVAARAEAVEKVRQPARKPRTAELAARRVVPAFDGGGWDGQLFGPDPHHLPKPHRGTESKEEILKVASTCRNLCDEWSKIRPDAGCPYKRAPVQDNDGFITGHIVHPDGSQASEGRVYYSSQSTDGRDKFGIVDFFGGTYATWLAPGDYLLYAFMKTGPQPAGGTHLSGRNMVSATITSGEVTDLDLRANDETAQIQAQLMGVNGPVAGGKLIVDGTFGGGPETMKYGPGSDASGQIEILITAGEHLIGAWAPGYELTITPVNLLPDEVEDMGPIVLTPQGARLP